MKIKIKYQTIKLAYEYPNELIQMPNDFLFNLFLVLSSKVYFMKFHNVFTKKIVLTNPCVYR